MEELKRGAEGEGTLRKRRKKEERKESVRKIKKFRKDDEEEIRKEWMGKENKMGKGKHESVGR